MGHASIPLAPTTRVITLILSRHGESVYSAEHRANGDPTLPVPLTATGRMQAQALGKALADMSIDACITSEFPRAIETAGIALAGSSIETEIDGELNDIRYGELEGQPLDRYHAWTRSHSPSDRIPGGGESRLDVLVRCLRALGRLQARPEPVILAVCHELLIGDILAAAGHPTVSTPHDVEYATPYTLSLDGVARACNELSSQVSKIAT